MFSHYIGNRNKPSGLTLAKSSLASIQVGNLGLQFLFSSPTSQRVFLFSAAQLLKQLMKTELLPIKQSCSSLPTHSPTLAKYFGFTVGCTFPFLWLFEGFCSLFREIPQFQEHAAHYLNHRSVYFSLMVLMRRCYSVLNLCSIFNILYLKTSPSGMKVLFKSYQWRSKNKCLGICLRPYNKSNSEPRVKPTYLW